MNDYTNENILKLIFKNYNLKESGSSFDKIYNSTLSSFILSTFNYNSVFTSKRKHEVITNRYCGTNQLVELPNNKMIRISTEEIQFWDMKNHKCMWTHKLDHKIISTTQLPSGQLITFTHSGQIQFWSNDYKFIEKTITFEGCIGFRKKIFCLQNGNLICFGYKDDQDRLIILDSQTGGKIKTLSIQLGFVNSIVNLSSDKFAYCCDNGFIDIWGAKDYNCITSFYGEFDKSTIKAMLFVEKKNLLISGSRISLKFWDISHEKPECVHRIGDVIVCQLLMLDNKYFATVGGLRDIRIWSLNNFQCVNELTGCQINACSTVILKDYRIITSSDTKLVVWEY
jgi:WD40 repeat protein